MKFPVFTPLLTLAASLGIAASAWGHAVETDYFFDLFSEQLSFTATYSTGEPMAGAEVTIYAPDNATIPWERSYADDQGTFAFTPDESITGEWRIEFRQQGHQDILLIPVTGAGVDYTNITQGPQQDIHYAAPAPELLGIATALGLGAIAIATRRRLSS